MKAVLDDRLPLHIPAQVFPIGPRAADTARDVIRLLYAPKLRDKLAAVGRLAGALRGGRP